MRRAAAVFQSGRWQAPFSPFVPGSGNIWTRDNRASTRAASQTYAKVAVNQFNYSNVNWSFDGKAAPSFYGYGGYGFNGLKPGFATTAAVVDEAVIVAPPGHARVKVTLVNTKNEEEKAAFLAPLAAAFAAGVPVPILTQVPSGVVVGEGTDAPCNIVDLATGEYWDIWRLKFVEGIGWTAQGGGYVGPGSAAGFNGKIGEWNGIYHAAPNLTVNGTRASGLAALGGLITMQDLVEVLRGKPDFGHALSLIIGTTKAVGGLDIHVAPATKNDGATSANSHPFLPNNINAGAFSYTEEKPNGAYTAETPHFFDGVPEGSHFMLPATMTVGEFPGITGTLARAFFRTLVKYGMITTDRTGSGCIIGMESPGTLGSPYTGRQANAKVNPIAGCNLGKYGSYEWGHGFTKVSQFVPAAWADATLPAIVEEPTGPASWVMSVLGSEAMRQLEVLEPYAS